MDTSYPSIEWISARDHRKVDVAAHQRVRQAHPIGSRERASQELQVASALPIGGHVPLARDELRNQVIGVTNFEDAWFSRHRGSSRLVYCLSLTKSARRRCPVFGQVSAGRLLAISAPASGVVA